MSRQQCTDCGYIYEPADFGGIPLVDRLDWECPGVEGAICGASVDKYDLLEPDSPLEEAEEDEGQSEASTVASAVKPGELSAEKADKALKDIAAMIDDNDLVLRPDWQRYYVWSNKQASLLVESLF